MNHEHSPEALLLEDFTVPAGHPWSRLVWIGLGVGVVGLAASLLLAGGPSRQFYFSWLVAFIYFLSIALGGLFFVLCHFVTKAGWSVVVRRLAEHCMATLPFFILLFIPIWLGRHELFDWTHAEAIESDPLLQKKAPYLNETFFLVRAAIYFLLWTALSVWFSVQSRRQDRTGDLSVTRRLQNVSAPGLFVFAFTTTFASIDWLMSLDPHWYSTIFGVYYFSGCVVAVYAFMILAAASTRGAVFFRGVVTPEHFHDLGKLLFSFIVFWAYIAFSQFFLIWYGNIPEETLWYVHRLEGTWWNVSFLLAVGHFVIPFFFLMSRNIKRRIPLLLVGTVWMLFMHLVDIYWLVMPTLHPHGVQLSVVDLTALMAVGGFFLGAFGWALRQAALVPVKDPRLPESLSFENI